MQSDQGDIQDKPILPLMLSSIKTEEEVDFGNKYVKLENVVKTEYVEYDENMDPGCKVEEITLDVDVIYSIIKLISDTYFTRYMYLHPYKKYICQ